MIIINGMPDHLHIVIGMRPSQSLSDLMQDIKGSSSKWINDNKLVKGKFQWHEVMVRFRITNPHCQN
jgi:putative transposase